MRPHDRIEVERTLTQAEFDAFAALSGDDNPIHVDAAFSARTRFGRPVAHGAFLTSILLGLARRLAPEGRLTAQDVQFPAPTFAGEPITFSAVVDQRTPDAVTLAAEARRTGDDAVTCRALFTISLGAHQP